MRSSNWGQYGEKAVDQCVDHEIRRRDLRWRVRRPGSAPVVARAWGHRLVGSPVHGDQNGPVKKKWTSTVAEVVTFPSGAPWTTR